MSSDGHGRRALAGVRLAFGGALLAFVFTIIVGSASAEPATTCVKATKIRPPKPAKAHYTGGYTDKKCSEPNATHEGQYEKLADLTAEQETKIAALLEHVKVEEKGVQRKADDPVLGRQRAGRQRGRQNRNDQRRGQPRDRLRRKQPRSDGLTQPGRGALPAVHETSAGSSRAPSTRSKPKTRRSSAATTTMPTPRGPL